MLKISPVQSKYINKIRKLCKAEISRWKYAYSLVLEARFEGRDDKELMQRANDLKKIAFREAMRSLEASELDEVIDSVGEHSLIKSMPEFFNKCIS